MRQKIIGRDRLMMPGCHHDGTVRMTLQTARTWLAVEDLMTGTPENFFSSIAQDAFSRSIPEHDALPLVQRIDPIRSLR
jgi:hypothetical protein